MPPGRSKSWSTHRAAISVRRSTRSSPVAQRVRLRSLPRDDVGDEHDRAECADDGGDAALPARNARPCRAMLRAPPVRSGTARYACLAQMQLRAAAIPDESLQTPRYEIRTLHTDGELRQPGRRWSSARTADVAPLPRVLPEPHVLLISLSQVPAALRADQCGSEPRRWSQGFEWQTTAADAIVQIAREAGSLLLRRRLSDAAFILRLERRRPGGEQSTDGGS